MKTGERKSRVKTWAIATTATALALLIVYAPKTAAQDTNTFPGNGSAGIGTTSPGNINGSWPLNAGRYMQITGQASAAYTAALIINGYDYSQLVFSSQNGTSNQRAFDFVQQVNHLDFRSLNDAGGGVTNIMTFLHGGNVGIGTASPATTFHVAGAGIQQSGNFYNLTRLTNAAGTKGLYLGYDGSSSNGIIASVDGTDLQFWSHNGSAWGERVRFTSNGNVGIGTTSPGFGLHVVDGSTTDKYVQFLENNNAAATPLRFGMRNSAAQGQFEIDVNSANTADIVLISVWNRRG